MQSYFGNDNDVDKTDGLNWAINTEGNGQRQNVERKRLGNLHVSQLAYQSGIFVGMERHRGKAGFAVE